MRLRRDGALAQHARRRVRIAAVDDGRWHAAADRAVVEDQGDVVAQRLARPAAAVVASGSPEMLAELAAIGPRARASARGTS